MAIVPHEVPVLKDTKAETIKLSNGITFGLISVVVIRRIMKSAVRKSDIRLDKAHAKHKIIIAVSITLKPLKILSAASLIVNIFCATLKITATIKAKPEARIKDT
jgi:hypothetical protein